MPREKWKRKSGRAEVGAKSEKVEQELEGKFPPYSWFLFFWFHVCFIFSMFEK